MRSPSLTVPAPGPFPDRVPRAALVWRSTHPPGEAAFRVRRAWGMHLYPYRATLQIDDGPVHAILPGSASFTPPDALARYVWPEGAVHLFAHVEWPADVLDPTEGAPAVFPVGERFSLLWSRLEEALSWPEEARTRRDARVWDLWQELLTLARPRAAGLPEPVVRALAAIEGGLDRDLPVPEIARAAGVSGDHLGRLFRRHLNETVVARIARRRAERAVELLTGTDLPIKSIARLVGIDDSQRFNKLIRARTGRPPGGYRVFR